MGFLKKLFKSDSSVKNDISLDEFIQALKTVYYEEQNGRNRERIPEFKIVRAYGEKLYNEGGKQAMQDLWYSIQSEQDLMASRLDRYWHGVGSWMA